MNRLIKALRRGEKISSEQSSYFWRRIIKAKDNAYFSFLRKNDSLAPHCNSGFATIMNETTSCYPAPQYTPNAFSLLTYSFFSEYHFT